MYKPKPVPGSNLYPKTVSNLERGFSNTRSIIEKYMKNTSEKCCPLKKTQYLYLKISGEKPKYRVFPIPRNRVLKYLVLNPTRTWYMEYRFQRENLDPEPYPVNTQFFNTLSLTRFYTRNEVLKKPDLCTLGVKRLRFSLAQIMYNSNYGQT